MRLNAIFFDLDGTLVQTLHLYENACTQILGEYGVNLSPEEFKNLYTQHLSLSNLLEKCGLDPSLESEIRPKRDAAYIELLKKDTEWYEGAKETLETINNTIPTAIVTGSWKTYTDAINERLGIYNLCRECITVDEMIGQGKPNPYSILLAAERLEVEPSYCMYIGDQQVDVGAANNAGMVSCLVQTEFTTDDATKGADIVLKDIRETLDLLT